MKFKVGQKIIVKDCFSGGNFEVGDIVEIVQIGTDDGEDENCYGAISPWDGLKWYLSEDEVGPITNADKIRSMSDEELSEFLCNGIENVFCDLCEKCSCRYAHCKDELCKTNLIKWLKQQTENRI